MSIRRVLFACLGLVLVGAGVACSGGHSGFLCNTGASPSFSSTECSQKVAQAMCHDGGTVVTGDADAGTERLCCAWQDCNTVPLTP